MENDQIAGNMSTDRAESHLESPSLSLVRDQITKIEREKIYAMPLKLGKRFIELHDQFFIRIILISVLSLLFILRLHYNAAKKCSIVTLWIYSSKP